MQGWISLHRKILENPVVCKDGDYFAVWCYLLLKAAHKPYDILFQNKRIVLNPGQLLTGRKVISIFFSISESKVDRILKTLKSEQQIEQQTSSRNRLITILKWTLYQQSEQQIEQQVNNKWTTSEQQVNTYNNTNKINNRNKVNKIYSDEAKKIIDELNKIGNRNFRYSDNNLKHVQARLNEGFSIQDCLQVIEIKKRDIYFINNPKYFNPETLFRSSNFEKYLNELESPIKEIKEKDMQFIASIEKINEWKNPLTGEPMQ